MALSSLSDLPLFTLQPLQPGGNPITLPSEVCSQIIELFEINDNEKLLYVSKKNFIILQNVIFEPLVDRFKLRMPPQDKASLVYKAFRVYKENLPLIRALPLSTEKLSLDRINNFINLVVKNDQDLLLCWLLEGGEDSIPTLDSSPSLSADQFPIDPYNILLMALTDKSFLCFQALACDSLWKALPAEETQKKEPIITQAFKMDNLGYYRTLMKIDSFITQERLSKDFVCFAKQKRQFLIEENKFRQIDRNSLFEVLLFFAEKGELESFEKLFKYLTEASQLPIELIGKVFSKAAKNGKACVVALILQSHAEKLASLPDCYSKAAYKVSIYGHLECLTLILDVNKAFVAQVIGTLLGDLPSNDPNTAECFKALLEKLPPNTNIGWYLWLAVDRWHKQYLQALIKSPLISQVSDKDINIVFSIALNRSINNVGDVDAEDDAKLFITRDLVSKYSSETLELALKWTTMGDLRSEHLQIIVSSPQFSQISERAFDDAFLSFTRTNNRGCIDILMNSCPISRNSLGFSLKIKQDV